MTVDSRNEEKEGHVSQVPRIEPVPAGVKRPLWSVMIPTYNCARYLRQTLESVLAQDPGPEHMQIEVVDDVSTKDDPEAVVRDVGRGRVQFYRKIKNGGATANFNTCIERSVGQLVHILHGDDYVEPEFYLRFASAFEESPQCAAVYSRVSIVDAQSRFIRLSDFVTSLAQETADARELMLRNSLCTPAAVVRRRFYELNGGFNTDLIHTADWEMWVRAITRGRARMLDKALASYRWFTENDTHRLYQSADNLRDHLRLASVWQSAGLPGFDRRAFEQMVSRHAIKQFKTFHLLANAEAVRANYRFLQEHCSIGQRLWIHLRVRLNAIKRYMGRKVQPRKSAR